MREFKEAKFCDREKVIMSKYLFIFFYSLDSFVMDMHKATILLGAV